MQLDARSNLAPVIDTPCVKTSTPVEVELACEYCGRTAKEFAGGCNGLVGLKSHISQCKNRPGPPRARHGAPKVPKAHKRPLDDASPKRSRQNEPEPSCDYCGRTAADFAGREQGLKAHIPQCKDRPLLPSSGKRKFASSLATQPAGEQAEEVEREDFFAKLGVDSGVAEHHSLMYVSASRSNAMPRVYRPAIASAPFLTLFLASRCRSKYEPCDECFLRKLKKRCDGYSCKTRFSFVLAWHGMAWHGMAWLPSHSRSASVSYCSAAPSAVLSGSGCSGARPAPAARRHTAGARTLYCCLGVSSPTLVTPQRRPRRRAELQHWRRRPPRRPKFWTGYWSITRVPPLHLLRQSRQRQIMI